jgi:cobalt transporter subunit CbtA
MTIATFKKLVVVAAQAGLVAGLLLTAIQQIQVVPLIHKAEVYEQAAENANRASGAAASVEHDHDTWQPENGWKRNLFTAAANIVIALGFALLLGAAAALRGAKLDWRSGLLWGLGGYVVFFVAPSLGLPPELPGTQAAALTHRQIWWAATSVLTAAGLAFLVFSGRRAGKILGAALLIVPHLIGAPQPEVYGGAAPAELAQAFVIAAFIANAVFWLALGGLFGFFHRRLAD